MIKVIFQKVTNYGLILYLALTLGTQND